MADDAGNRQRGGATAAEVAGARERATARLLAAARSGAGLPQTAVGAAVDEVADWCFVDLLRDDGILSRVASARGAGLDVEMTRSTLARFAIPDPDLLRRVHLAGGPIRVEDPYWLADHRAVVAPVAGPASLHGLLLTLVPIGGVDEAAEDLRFTGELATCLGNLLEAASEIRHARHPAFPEGELDVLLEPILNIESGEIAGGECLIALPEPGTMVSTRVAGELAATDSIAREVREWSRQKAWRIAAAVRGRGLAVCFDLSGAELASSTIATELEQEARAGGVDPSTIVLDVAVADAIPAHTIPALRAAGFRVAIDGVGSGRSLPAELLEAAPDALKLSPALVRDAPRHAATTARLASFADLGRRLGIDLIAEGVETESELALLSRLGFRWAQGPLFGPPAGLAKLLERAPAAAVGPQPRRRDR